MIDTYVIKRVLESVIDADVGMDFLKAPFALGGDAAASDGRLVVRFEGHGEGLTKITGDPAREAVLMRATDPDVFTPIGKTTLRALADWAGRDVREVDEDGGLTVAFTKRAAVGEAVVDPCRLAKAFWPLSLAGDCRVEVGVSDAHLTGVRKLLFVAPFWTVGCMGCNPDPQPGEDTRLTLEPMP